MTDDTTALPPIPDDDSDFTPDLARNIVEKYQAFVSELLARIDRIEKAAERLVPIEASAYRALPSDEIERLRSELFSLCEDTEERCASVASKDTEGKQGAFARGRIYEAKGIRNAMGEVFRLALIDVGQPTLAMVAEIERLRANRAGAMPSEVEIAKAICKSASCQGIDCCQWPSQGGRLKCAVDQGGYKAAAQAVLAILSPQDGTTKPTLPMAGDVVQRLRNQECSDTPSLRLEAADEIERLRNDLVARTNVINKLRGE